MHTKRLMIAIAAGVIGAGPLSPTASPQNTGRVGVLIPGSPSQTIEQLIGAGQLEEARQRLDLEVAQEGQRARNLLLWGMILYRQEKYEQALAELRQSFSLNEKDPDVHKLLGLCLTKLEKPKMAEPFFQIAVKLAPDDFMARYYLGLHSYTTNRFELAEAEFRRVIALKPDYLDGYSFLGLALEELGREDEAIRVYKKAIELSDQSSSTDEKPYFYLGRYFNRLQRTRDGLPWLRRAVEVNPNASEPPNLLGKILSETGEDEEALLFLERAAASDPVDPSPHYMMMRIYTKLGRSEDTRRARLRFRELEQLKKNDAPE